MRLDATDLAVDGFAHYIDAVAASLAGEALVADCDANADLATAIIMVSSRVPDLAEQALLLAWDEVNGWALRIQVSDDGDTTALAYLGQDILAGPADVQLFLTQAIDGAHPGTLHPPEFRLPNQADGLEQRLAEFV